MRRAHNHPACLTQNSQLTTQNSRRAGFTLVELLVVIAIIGILVALTAGAVVRFIGVQARDNTDIVIRKIQPLLQAQWKAVIDQAKTEPISQNAMVMANDDERLARIIHIKLRLRQEFPMNFNEAYNPTPAAPLLPPIKTYQANPGQAGITATPPAPAITDPTNWAAQNSACLLMALMQARKGATALNPDDLGVSVVVDTNGDKLPEIVDGWGKPIVLIRFPYENPDFNPPGGLTGLPGRNDDVDTEGLLMNWAGNTRFTDLFHPPTPSGRSYKLFPVLVSGGANGTLGLGLNPPRGFTGVVSDQNQANDNIYNYNLFKLGARGD